MSERIRVVSVSPYKGATVKIELEGREPVFMNRETVDKFGLRAGADLPLSALGQMMEEEQYRKARERALYLLDIRDYSYVDMYKKLEGAYGEDVAFRVMDRLVELGAINDRRYAEGLTRHYVEVKGFGRYRAFREMRGKGLTAEVINAALDEYDEDFWFGRLYELVEKKYLRYLEDEKGVNRVKNALVRYGYSFDLIKQVLAQIEEDYEEDPDED